MKWCIAADSSCDLFPNDLASERFAFHTIPFGIRVGEREYIDDETLDTAEMISATEACPTASRTVCPAPGPWADVFRRAEQSIAITISAKLSGSHNSAQAARDLDVHENVLRKWVKEFGSDPVQAFPGHGQMKPEQQEIEQLRREVQKLKAERDILKKAAAFFTREAT